MLCGDYHGIVITSGSYHCAGQSCGEDIESGWYHVNPLGTSTREMGPGARHETLNDHWSGWNFQKIIGFSELNPYVSFIN